MDTRELITPANPYPTSFQIAHAIAEIKRQYGHEVKIVPKSLHKFGRTLNADNGAKTTVMHLPGDEQRHETYLTDNLIDTISSSSADDDIELVLYGNTYAGGVFTETDPIEVTLNGQSKVTFTPQARINRVENNNGTELVGNIYVYEDGAITDGVPDTAAEVHMMLKAGEQQSQKAATVYADGEYGLISCIYASVNRNSPVSSHVDIEFEVREAGGVFRPRLPQFTVDSVSDHILDLSMEPYFIVKPNSDIRIVATADTNNTIVTAGICGYYAIVHE